MSDNKKIYDITLLVTYEEYEKHLNATIHISNVYKTYGSNVIYLKPHLLPTSYCAVVVNLPIINFDLIEEGYDPTCDESLDDLFKCTS